MERNARIFIAGHRGLVGAALLRRLKRDGCGNLLTATRDRLDLRDQAAVNYWFRANRPGVCLSGRRHGGRDPRELHASRRVHLRQHAHPRHRRTRGPRLRLPTRAQPKPGSCCIGSSCIYPREAAQPMKEESLLTGPLEATNASYAIAKIAGIQLCQSYRTQYGSNFISAMPTNLYGPNDNFDLESSHVLPALIRKFHEARISGTRDVVIWGSGSPRREFLHVDDLADACVFLMRRYDGRQHVNVGTGEDVTIRQLAETLRAVNFPEARLTFDSSKPDGAPASCSTSPGCMRSAGDIGLSWRRD